MTKNENLLNKYVNELSLINKNIDMLNQAITLLSVLNILLCLAVFTLASWRGQYPTINLEETIILGSDILRIFAFVTPFFIFCLFILALVWRELKLRRGRIVFEYVGELRHRLFSLDVEHSDGAGDMIYLEIKQFALNEKLPFTRGSLGAAIYLFTDVNIIVAYYMTLIVLARSSFM